MQGKEKYFKEKQSMRGYKGPDLIWYWQEKLPGKRIFEQRSKVNEKVNHTFVGKDNSRQEEDSVWGRGMPGILKELQEI